MNRILVSVFLNGASAHRGVETLHHPHASESLVD